MKIVLYKTLHHFFPSFNNWLKAIDDPRNKKSVVYPISAIIWKMLLLFMLKLGSRRQVNFQLNNREMLKNVPFLAKEELEKIAHGDTLNYSACRLNPEELNTLRAKMIRRLIRMRALERYRLKGYYLIGIDATGYLKFNYRHCDYCLKTEQGGKTTYYHPVLEAKLILGKDMALSIETEFIENQAGDATIQDCELKAFYRLAARLKKTFPRLKTCLLLDALYANKNVFGVCRNNNWKYITTFKKGSMPATYREYETLKELNKDSRQRHEEDVLTQDYAWVNDIDYEGHLLNILECKETRAGRKKKTHVWVTNFKIDEYNIKTIANQGGRLRWQIEEGFNMQKNGGYNLEHPYSKDIIGSKNFYLLLQIAHTINQLMEKGSLLTETVKKLFGSIRNFSRILLEDLRNSVFDPKEIEAIRPLTFQIRLHSP